MRRDRKGRFSNEAVAILEEWLVRNFSNPCKRHLEREIFAASNGLRTVESLLLFARSVLNSLCLISNAASSIYRFRSWLHMLSVSE